MKKLPAKEKEIMKLGRDYAIFVPFVLNCRCCPCIRGEEKVKFERTIECSLASLGGLLFFFIWNFYIVLFSPALYRAVAT
jgi:hypothetical protein